MAEQQNKLILPMLETSMGKEKGFALLIDPDKADQDYLVQCVRLANESQAKMIFIGGSLVANPIDPVFDQVRALTNIPLVLFPGSVMQVSARADAVLFLSLISGRNPDFLIGNHVLAAPFLHQHPVEILPTGYILVDGGQATTVEYISQTRPIPANKPEIAVATALAGQMLGQKIIYMDAGSGALHPVPVPMIQAVAEQISVPIIVGGGIRHPDQAMAAYEAGADIVVVGNHVEEDPGFLTAMRAVTLQANSTMRD